MVLPFLRNCSKRQLADLGVQALQVDARSRRFALVLAEHPSRAFEKLGFPLGDLIGVDVKLLRQLGERLLPLHGGQSHLRLEGRGVVPARSLAHRFS